MVGLLIMKGLYFTVDADLLELVDSIGHEYEKINDDDIRIKVDLEYEKEQYGLDVDVLTTAYGNELSDEMLSNIFLGPELTEALVYTERVY